MTAFNSTNTNTNTMTTTSTAQDELNDAISWGLSDTHDNWFARDVARKSQKYTLSVRQAECLIKAHQTDIERKKKLAARQVESQARIEAGITAPENRQIVTGVVDNSHLQNTPFGDVRKVMVTLENGSKVRGNAPSGVTPQIGDRVRFTATFTRSEKDSSFAFWSRPTKWTKI